MRRCYTKVLTIPSLRRLHVIQALYRVVVYLEVRCHTDRVDSYQGCFMPERGPLDTLHESLQKQYIVSKVYVTVAKITNIHILWKLRPWKWGQGHQKWTRLKYCGRGHHIPTLAKFQPPFELFCAQADSQLLNREKLYIPAACLRWHSGVYGAALRPQPARLLALAPTGTGTPPWTDQTLKYNREDHQLSYCQNSYVRQEYYLRIQKTNIDCQSWS